MTEPERLRQKLRERLDSSLEIAAKWEDISRQVTALSLDYQKARAEEMFKMPVQRGAVVGELDVRLKPPSFDGEVYKIQQGLGGKKPGALIQDIISGKLFVFVSQ